MNRKAISCILVFVVCIAVYGAFFITLHSNGIYEITENTHNDRFFSMDDSYYVNQFYSAELDDTGRIVKHPLFVAFCHYFTLAEKMILGEISTERHYMLIVLLQIIVQAIGVLFLYKILVDHYKLGCINTVLMVLIYGFSISSLIFALIAESYVFSGTLLIFSYWCALEKKPVLLVIAGILLGGVTITNIFIWFLIVFFFRDKLYKRLIIMASGAIGLLAAIFVLPVRDVFYSQCFAVFTSSPENYSDTFPFIEALNRGFFALFGSTYFNIDTINKTPFGKYENTSVSFVPSASPVITVLIFIWLAFIIYSVYKNRKEFLIRAPLIVILFNIGLHVIKQYGLKEAFLYSLHHSFAQILIIALLFGVSQKSRIARIAVPVFLSAYLAVMIIINIQAVWGLSSHI